MKNAKKLLAVLLVAVLMLGMTACGNKQTATADSGTGKLEEVLNRGYHRLFPDKSTHR